MKLWGCAGVLVSVACTGERPEFGQRTRDASATGMVQTTEREQTFGGEIDASITTPEHSDSDPEETSVLLAPEGLGCEDDEDCESTHCADGVCCDTACDGVCSSCDQSGHEGVCTATPKDDACADLLCPASTECLTYASNSLEDNCDGLNQCKAHAGCDEVPEGNGTPCQSGAGECDGQGECVVPDTKALGEECDTGEECGTGSCAARADGTLVCCDSDCDSTCQACTNDGHCSTFPADDGACGVIDCPSDTSCATYPDDVTANRCASFGQCITLGAACEPTYSVATTACGSSQICDGTGSCVLDCPTTKGANRTCTEDCPCSTGEGICTTDADCSGGTVCATGAGAKFGFSGNTCVAAHCDNDAVDGGETSADCGGECGCRATYEVLTLTGAPSGVLFSIVGMSGDGSRFIANSWELMFGYAFVISRSGEVTQLDHLGGSGSAGAISSDGSVVVGSLTCPGDTCSGTYKWVDAAEPIRVGDYGNVHGTSASGSAFVAGMAPPYYSGPSANGNILELDSAVGMSPDGMFVIGKTDSDSDIYGIWSAQSNTVTPITKNGWSTAQATAIKGSPPVVVGSGSDGTGSVGFRWVGGQLTEFGSLPGMASHFAMDVSSDGTVAVGYAGADTTSTSSAFIWSESGGIRLLKDELVARGLELPLDAQLVNADFITDDGTTIVGGNPSLGLWRVTLTD